MCMFWFMNAGSFKFRENVMLGQPRSRSGRSSDFAASPRRSRDIRGGTAPAPQTLRQAQGDTEKLAQRVSCCRNHVIESEPGFLYYIARPIIFAKRVHGLPNYRNVHACSVGLCHPWVTIIVTQPWRSLGQVSGRCPLASCAEL